MKNIKYIFIVLALSLVVLSGCGLPGLGDSNSKDSVKITSTETSETKIMANVEKLMIEHYTNGEVKPSIIGNLGSSIIQHNALMRGDANMSAVRYTGTELTSVLDAPPTKDTKKQWMSRSDYLKRNMTKNIIILLDLKTHMHLWSHKKLLINII